VLYHETTFDKSKNDLAALTGHSTTIDAATVAAEAEAGALIIGHFSARYRETDALVQEARSVFPESFAATDGTTYEIGNISS
jgi:ribonuclease Z